MLIIKYLVNIAKVTGYRCLGYQKQHDVYLISRQEKSSVHHKQYQEYILAQTILSERTIVLLGLFHISLLVVFSFYIKILVIILFNEPLMQLFLNV